MNETFFGTLGLRSPYPSYGDYKYFLYDITPYNILNFIQSLE
jgi:hypothetical protein